MIHEPVNDADPNLGINRERRARIAKKAEQFFEHASEIGGAAVLIVFLAILAYGILAQGLPFSPPVWVLGLIFLAILIYFLPAKIAYDHNRKQKKAILVLNIFLGWTFVFWALALVWAYVEE